MEAVVLIPARYGSTRFPGKPLSLIAGKYMIERTWQVAKSAKGVDEVYIATDDERIATAAANFGAKVQMTPSTCTNGTERILAALELLGLKPNIVINLQGDAPLTPPQAIEALIKTLKNDAHIGFATLAARLSQIQYNQLIKQKADGAPGGTLVTFDCKGKALYFSKSIIPFVRNAGDSNDNANHSPVYRHIGIYAYRFDVLKQYNSLAPTPLELTEGLEQLRALEHGIPIQVVTIDLQGRTHWSVDSPEDAKIAEQIIAREGELASPKLCST